ncbi:MAG: efflux RND transporter periplasmic adaptor subunit [Bryobacteraceae bacterium]
MKRIIFWLIVVGVVAGGIAWLTAWKTRPPEVPVTPVKRGTIVSTLPTNGRVEPIEWASARTDREGLVEKILVEKGRFVSAGAPLIELDARDARADLAAAQSRIAQARADLDVVSKGGRPVDLAEISSGLDRAKLDRDQARKEYETLKRLEEKKAVPAAEVIAAKDRLDRAELQIRGFEQRRQALVSSSDKTAAEARLHDAQAAAKLAEEKIALSVIHAPIEGTIYQFDLKRGAFLNRGDLVANIGRLDRVRVNVFVDEPELGRVAVGMPVQITWDARPAQTWTGSVDRLPTQVVPLGTRQVGEVICIIDNPGRELLPGTNINAEIRSKVVENVLTVPKEVLRRESGESGVFVLEGGKIHWRKITVGAASVTRTQVDGLKEGDLVVLPSERVVKDGQVARAAETQP